MKPTTDDPTVSALSHSAVSFVHVRWMDAVAALAALCVAGAISIAYLKWARFTVVDGAGLALALAGAIACFITGQRQSRLWIAGLGLAVLSGSCVVVGRR